MSLMISISGIRGVVGESLTPDVVVRYAAAFGEYCKHHNPDPTRTPEIVLGRDGRITGKIIANLVSSTLLATGVNVRALGVCPTPTIALAVERLGAAGGISITASHNPMPWNGLKFFAPTGLFLDAEENKDVWRIADSHDVGFARWERIGTHTADDSWIQKHIAAVLSLPYLNKAIIRRRRLKVVLDAVNAAGGISVPLLLRELGCDVIEMHCDVSGVFAHTPEPLPENLTALCERVKAERADIGIAVDPDVDRLVFITEQGTPFGEEYTIASVVKFVLERERQLGNTAPQSVVINLSTTRAVEDIAAEYGAKVYRTPVGEINVAKRMRACGAVVGGEGSGGVILPAVHTGRDALVGVALILQLVVEFDGPVSALKASLPTYEIAKSKIELGTTSPDEALQRIVRTAGNQNVNTDDGVRIDFGNSWVHLRKSNTEPLVRVIAEARTMGEALAIVERFAHALRS